MSTEWYRKIWIALCFALSALLATAIVFLFIMPEGLEAIPFFSFISPITAALLAVLIWPKQQPTIWRNILSGFIISTLSHPVTWYLVFFFYWLYDVIMARLSISNLPNPIEALQFAIGMSFWSLIIAGWITAPIGIL
ncbi:hypothetical protein TI05_10205, partial [Achromatium sp. WMS3]